MISDDQLVSLVYRSVPSPEGQKRAVIADIIATSQTNNSRYDLTGVLTLCGGYFIQVIEGPKLHVESTFSTITKDPRHHAIEACDLVPIEQRLFPDWCMASVLLEPDYRRALCSILNQWDDVASNAVKVLAEALARETSKTGWDGMHGGSAARRGN